MPQDAQIIQRLLRESATSQKRLTLGGLNNCNRVSSKASAALFSSIKVTYTFTFCIGALSTGHSWELACFPCNLGVYWIHCFQKSARSLLLTIVKVTKLIEWYENGLHLPLSVRKLSSSEMWSKASKLVRYSRSRFEAMKPTTSFWRHCVRILSIKTSISAPAFPGAVL